MKPTEQEVYDCLQVIVDNKEAKALNYAVNYARYGIGMTGHELKIQCLYVLSNMQYWRGPQAKEVRKTLKAFTK
jgi:hypothetical protein